MTDTTPAAAVQIPAAGIYQLDPAASTVTFATRHMFGLAPVKGTFRLVSGQITIADPVTSSTVSAVIDAASFATGNPQRDRAITPLQGESVLAAQRSIGLAAGGHHQPGLWLMRNPIRSHPQCTANRARASAAGTSRCRVDARELPLCGPKPRPRHATRQYSLIRPPT